MKYFNKKTVIDGITFDSQKEGARYLQLKALQQVGEIIELECQPVFKYMSKDCEKVLFKYIADFKYKYLEPSREYDNEGNVSYYATEVIEDVKSTYTAKLPLFKLKKKLIEDQYPIKIIVID